MSCSIVGIVKYEFMISRQNKKKSWLLGENIQFRGNNVLTQHCLKNLSRVHNSKIEYLGCFSNIGNVIGRNFEVSDDIWCYAQNIKTMVMPIL